MSLFCKEEYLDGDNRFTCENCVPAQPRDARKQLLLDKPPKILTVHLKRFCAQRDGVYTKITAFVSFSQQWDLTKYSVAYASSPDSAPPIRYELYAVLVHDGLGGMHSGRGGTISSGHYYCYVRGNKPPGVTGANGASGDSAVASEQWYRFNDSSVSEVRHAEVFGVSAYMLFYQL